MLDYPYSQKELYELASQRTYRDDAKETAFLLGGIGTGNVSIGARGEFRDWEIFNSPGKGNHLPYSFFAIWVAEEGQEGKAKVLESRIHPPYSKSHGFSSGEVAGLPHLDSSTLRGEYPFVWVDFEDEDLPLEISLEAFTPFIPLNADDSGIPGAVIRYRVKNLAGSSVKASIVGSLANAVGFEGYDTFKRIRLAGEGKNEYREREKIRGLFYSSDISEKHLTYGTMALTTSGKNVTYKVKWLEGGWFDGMQDFWDDFRKDGKLEKISSFEATGSEIKHEQKLKVGSLGLYEEIAPGEEKVFEFFLTWHFPNRIRGWDGNDCSCSEKCERVKNYYATIFENAWSAASYLADHLERLEGYSRSFHQALFSTTLPWYVIDAISSNITVLRSPTCFRIENGTFLGWEGCHDQEGCCPGSCTHVWNYAQTLAFLFPELERSMREVEFNLETDNEGKMAFRTMQVFGKNKWDMLPAADGQLGTIVRLYREWKLSGDDNFLKKLWDRAKKALDFAFEYWDSDKDFVLDARQHNTYDIEFYGPNSLTNSIFFAALKAGACMAEYMGDMESAKRYRGAHQRGSKKMDDSLWGGEYYIQKIDDVDKYRYQYGTGCLSDQLLGQFLAYIAGLGYVLSKNHVKKAVKSIFSYNFRSSFKGHHNVQRTYALNDEKGLLLCSWPKGGRPKLPFVYSDEVWTGIEYQVATHLIYEGFIDEGLTIVRAVRERHDGYRRNPWNEVECGHHYARSLASWGLLIALSGFQYDMVEKTISFDPVVNKGNFSTFWSTGKAWGIYTQRVDFKTGQKEWNIEVLYGNLEGVKINQN